MKPSTQTALVKKSNPQNTAPGKTTGSLHTVWAQNATTAQVSPVFDALLRVLKTRFRVVTAMIFMAEKGAAVFNMRTGPDPAWLDCAAALALCHGQADELFVIEDAAPTSEPEVELREVRFYAGAPLVVSMGGSAQGMLCLIDTSPRGFSREDRLLLRGLAKAVSAMLLMPFNPIAAQAIALSAEKGVLLMDEEQLVEAVNVRFTKLTSFAFDDLLKSGVEDLLCLDRPSSGALVISHALLAEMPAQGMTRCHTKAGGTLPVEVFVFPLLDQNGRGLKTLLLVAPLFSGPIEDFLLSLRSAERAQLLSLHIAGLWSVDYAGLIGKLSGAPVSHLDVMVLEGLTGKRLDQAGIFDAERTNWEPFYKSIASHSLPGEVECCVDSAGYLQWYSMVGFKQYDARGQVMGYHGSFRNITARKLKEHALKKSTERQSLILKGTNDGAWDWDLETGEYYLSARWWEMMGRDSSAYPPGPEIWKQFIHPDDQSRVRADFEAAINEGRDAYQSEFRMLHQHGHYFPVLGRGHILRDTEGRAIRTSGANQDLTEERKSQARIELLKTCVESLQDVVLITQADPSRNPGPVIVYVNPAFEAGTGYTSAEVIGKTPRILQGPLTSRKTLDEISAALHGWKNIRCELANYKKNGELFWAELEIIPVAAEGGGRYTHWIGVQRDITERKRAEESLKAANERLAMTIHATALGLWVFYLDGRKAFRDEGWHKMLGDSPHAGVTSTEGFLERIHPEDRACIVAGIDEAAHKNDAPFENEFRMRHADGRWVWIQSRGKVTQRDAAGKALVLAGTHLDISAKVEARQALQATTERLDMALQASGLGLWTAHLGRDEGFRDGRWQKMLGYPHVDTHASANGWLELVHPDDVAIASSDQHKVLATEHEVFEKEFRMRHTDGRWLWIQSRGKVTEWDADGKPLAFSGTHLDITAKVEARLLAEKKDEQLARCLEHMNVGVTVQRDGIIKFANSAWLNMFGATHVDDVVGTKMALYLSPGDMEVLTWRREQLMAGATLPSIWFNGVRRDGQMFKVLTNSTAIEWEGQRHIMSTSTVPSDGAMLTQEVEKTRIRYEDLLADQVEKELVHTAHELHDSLGSQLAGISLQAASLKELGAPGKPLEEAIDRLLGNIKVASEITRGLARGLAPVDAWPGAFRYAVKKLCHDFTTTKGLQCAFEVDGDFDSVIGQQANHLYRITQEAIANALRHGAARRINVSLIRSGNEMALTIFDDGQGFEVRSVLNESRQGLGLSSMYARAHAIGAEITLEKISPRGFCVSVNWTQRQ